MIAGPGSRDGRTPPSEVVTIVRTGDNSAGDNPPPIPPRNGTTEGAVPPANGFGAATAHRTRDENAAGKTSPSRVVHTEGDEDYISLHSVDSNRMDSGRAVGVAGGYPSKGARVTNIDEEVVAAAASAAAPREDSDDHSNQPSVISTPSRSANNSTVYIVTPTRRSHGQNNLLPNRGLHMIGVLSMRSISL
eukprot:m.1247200 g.1247200  ORF g.1247200 m.1247200 type:complete len:191 (+) comp24690_c1_seq11:1546-2118(+)